MSMGSEPPPVRVERSGLGSMSGPAEGPWDGAAPRATGAVRLAGAMLAAGAAAWAVGIVVAGEDVSERITLADTTTGLGYVAGQFCLALVVLFTRGTGERKGRAFPIVLLALLPGAFVFNLVSLAYEGHAYEDLPAGLMILDACWPLSNLTMLVLGFAVLKVGRYRGPARWLVPACGLWLPVSMAGQAAGGGAATLVSAAWLLGTYTMLGLLLAARPAEVLR